uniref:Uncharacterized protein n=1 Tax=Picochlorum oklahomense TaxID=249345 RepID=A0A7S1CVW9_9CHLO|mmetsp:Transcript_107/g.233  ORF Transcript_107/g.233 Transcript_107/m.233 type:complete len:293 (+) Transcript_107:3-881(+)
MSALCGRMQVSRMHAVRCGGVRPSLVQSALPGHRLPARKTISAPRKEREIFIVTRRSGGIAVRAEKQHAVEVQEQRHTTTAALALFSLLCIQPDVAFASDAVTGSPPASSYYVSLGLFLLTLPGLWSLIKRSPKAKIKRKTFEVDGPAVEGHMPLDTRARQIFSYFKNYNYTVKSTGEVIVFEGNYRASLGQAAALVLYTAISLASTALVLSIAAPFGGNWWYLMCLISPAAGAYYLKNAERTEEFKVKMTTSDDDKTTDITVQGDEEEIERFRKELDLYEKGMEYVKGILE